MTRTAALRELTRFRFDGLAAFVYAAAFGAMFVLMALATQAPPLWMILLMVGFMAGMVFLALPEKRLALWMFYLLTVPLGAAKWVTIEPTFFFGENPDGLVLYISDMPLIVLFVWWGAELCLGKARVVRSPIFYPYLACLLWRAATILVARDKSLAAWNILMHVKFFVIFAWASSHLTDRRSIFLTIGCLLFDLILQGGLNTLSYFIKGVVSIFGLIKYDWQRIGGENIFRATGTIGPHNVQCHFYEMVMPLGMILLYFSKNGWVKFLSLLGIGLASIGTVFTFSRGGWVSVGLSMTVVTLLLYRRRLVGTTVLSLLVIASALAGAAFLLGPENVIQKRITQSQAVATTSRWHMLGVGIRMVAANPVMGVGANQAAEQLQEYFPLGVPRECWYEIEVRLFEHKRFIIPIHNKYLMSAAELGIGGMMLWIFFLYRYLATSVRVMRCREEWIAALGTWFLASNVGLFFHNMLSEFSYGTILEMFYMLPGLLSGIWQWGVDVGGIEPRPKRTRRTARRVVPPEPAPSAPAAELQTA